MIDEKFSRFIQEHHVLTLATCDGSQPYCCSCFYAYSQQANKFFVKTGPDTRHSHEIAANQQVAAAIALETSEVGKIQGLQITGLATFCDGDSLSEAKMAYLKKYPYAIASPGYYLAIEPLSMKLTDNRFGFGKKLLWNADN